MPLNCITVVFLRNKVCFLLKLHFAAKRIWEGGNWCIVDGNLNPKADCDHWTQGYAADSHHTKITEWWWRVGKHESTTTMEKSWWEKIEQTETQWWDLICRPRAVINHSVYIITLITVFSGFVQHFWPEILWKCWKEKFFQKKILLKGENVMLALQGYFELNNLGID